MGHARDSRYAARDERDVVRLLAENPFAWLVSAGGPDAAFTPLPLRAELDTTGKLQVLGHMARRNPHVARLKRNPAALALFMGPHAYVSPSWLDDRTQAPTWNYAAAAIELRVQVLEDADAIAAELAALTGMMEAGRDRAWRLQEMGDRYARLAPGVTAMRGEVVAVYSTFKLGQDESAEDFGQILAGLQHEGADALIDWMRAFAAPSPDNGSGASR